MRVVLLAALLLAAGCMPSDFDTTRDPPPPVAEIMLGADGSYRLNGRPVTSGKLDQELVRLQAEAPKSKTGRTKLQARIRYAQGVGYDAVMDMQERCQRAGISQIETPR